MRNSGRNAKLVPFNAWAESEAGLEPWPAEVQNGKPVFTLEQILGQLTRAGSAWTGIGPNPMPIAGPGTITYGFFDVASQVYSSERSQFQPLSEAQRAAVRDAFAIWSDYIAARFVEGPVASADINLGNIVTSEDHFSAYANYPGPGPRRGRYLDPRRHPDQPGDRPRRARLQDVAARDRPRARPFPSGQLQRRSERHPDL